MILRSATDSCQTIVLEKSERNLNNKISGGWFSIEQMGRGDSIRIAVKGNTLTKERTFTCDCECMEMWTILRIRQEAPL